METEDEEDPAGKLQSGPEPSSAELQGVGS